MRFTLFYFFTLAFYVGFTQPLLIQRATEPVVVDGVLDEPDWELAIPADNFMQFFPSDTSLAVAQTVLKLTYDDKFLYVGARMENLGPRNYVTPSLRRDFRGEANDGISIVIDAFKDRTNAFLFGVNPYGVQREGIVANGGSGSGSFSLTWDNKWYSAAEIYDGYWVVEMAIPFNTLRFQEGSDSWYVNFYRIDSEYAERSSWSQIPQNFDIISLAFSKEVVFDAELHKNGRNVSFIPYTLAGTTKNFTNQTPAVKTANIGFDAKVGVSAGLNLDVTVNPDFSQVEVDAQVTNLDRFEIFFPEQRQFFLENDDLFSAFGVGGSRPFFSRRIGVARDTATGQNIQNSLYGGLRLSGKLNDNWRIGVLNMQAGEVRNIGLPSTNFAVATLQRKVFTRSNLGFIVINKQAFQDSIKGDFNSRPDQFNRVMGMDFNLASKDNSWNGKVFYHRSFEPNQPDSAFSAGLKLDYSTVKWFSGIFTRNVGANFNPEVGFVRRTDIMQFAHTTWRNFYPKKGLIQRHGPGINFDMIGNQTFGLLDWDANLMYRIRYKSTAFSDFRIRREYTYLFSPFDPSGTGGLALEAGTDYANNLLVANFFSDQRKNFFYSLSSRMGGYFNGRIANFDGSLTYRYIPFGFVSLNVSYNAVRLPEPYNSANLFLIGTRFDVTFTDKLFFTTFFQYNNQLNNLNINSRLQWRFKPVSDLFIVYTDNYVTESFTDPTGRYFAVGDPRLRGLVLKLNYWLNW